MDNVIYSEIVLNFLKVWSSLFKLIISRFFFMNSSFLLSLFFNTSSVLNLHYILYFYILFVSLTFFLPCGRQFGTEIIIFRKFEFESWTIKKARAQKWREISDNWINLTI